MRLFLCVFIFLVTLESTGQALSLYDQDYRRNLERLPWSIMLNIAMIIWAAYLLGGQP